MGSREEELSDESEGKERKEGKGEKERRKGCTILKCIWWPNN